jgi:hypothetical protein
LHHLFASTRINQTHQANNPSAIMAQSNNIFLNTENLAFSLPLIIICLAYAYFKYVPLPMALSILGGLFVLYQIRLYSQARKNNKLTTLDESTINDLAGEEQQAESLKKKELAAKQRKAQNKLQMRLAQEKKQSQKKASANTTEEDMDEDDAMLMFAKGSRTTTKKTK